MKKLLCVLLCLSFGLFVLPGLAQQKSLLIGIAQFAAHPSLDNCREGFIQGLKDAGYTEGVNVHFDVQNAQADMALAASIANSMVGSKADLICAIATPMAVVAVNTADGKIPVIYTAVSAPIEAGLANADGSGISPATGTSDALPVSKQLATIRALLPQAKTVGILHTVGEVNSTVQLQQFEQAAGEFGLSIVSQGISAGPDIALALPGLLKQADCLTMLTDNTVVQYLDVVLDAAATAKVPVFGSEVEQVKRGCVAAEGLDYFALGRQTGQLAVRVLQGEQAAAIPFETIAASALYINSAACAQLGISLPQELAARATDMAKK